MVAIPFLRIYFSVRSDSRRVRVLVRNQQGEVLLIKGWFSRQWWELPGGGIARNESPIEAAARELYEETGVTDIRLRQIASFRHIDTATPYQVELFEATVPTESCGTPLIHRWEILEMGWFPLRNLPQSLNPLVARVLKTRDQH